MGTTRLVIFVAGDNGPSAEGSLTGTTNNMMTQNGVGDDVASQLKVINEIGGPKHENHYRRRLGLGRFVAVPVDEARAVTFRRYPQWPRGLVADKDQLGVTQFHHVIDIAPTIYEAANITFPDSVNGVKQTRIAGVSLSYTFTQTGKVQVAFEYAQQPGGDLTTGGTGKLFINGQPAGEGKIEKGRRALLCNRNHGHRYGPRCSGVGSVPRPSAVRL